MNHRKISHDEVSYKTTSEEHVAAHTDGACQRSRSNVWLRRDLYPCTRTTFVGQIQKTSWFDIVYCCLLRAKSSEVFACSK